MGLHDASQTISVVAGDRRFSVFTLDTGKLIKSFKAEPKSDDQPIGMVEVCSMTHISLDPTGTIAAASGSDKSVRIYDLLNGTCLAHAVCHSELVTSVKFMSTYDRIISTSADGCVLVWRLSKDVTRRILTRIQENVTLPGRLEARAAEKSLASNTAVSAPHQKTTPLRRTTDKKASTSKRDSITSILSEDNDVRLDGNPAKDPRADDVSKEDSAPVAAKQTTTSRGPGSRSRVTASISKPPITRSRHNSVSHPQPPKPQPTHPMPIRSGSASQTPPQKKPKEKFSFSPPTIKTSVSVPSGNRSSDAAGRRTLTVPGSARSRATSLTEPTASTLKLDKAEARIKVDERQVLSDHSQQDPPVVGDEDESESSDDALPKEDKLKLSLQGLHIDDIVSSPSSTAVDGIAAHKPDVCVGSPTTEDITVMQPEDSDQATSEVDPCDENGVSEEKDSDEELADDNGASEGRDSDDVDGDDSISDAGSDIDIPHSHRRGASLGGSGSFEEGERPGDSPSSERTYGLISPVSRVASMGAFASNRRSLSARFLAAHAASVMLDLLKTTRQNSQGTSGGNSKDIRTSEESGATQGLNEGQDRQENQERPLEERLNLRSLNSVALKWKQRALGATQEPTSQSDGAEQDVKTPAHSQSRPGMRSDDYQKEVERTRKRLAELGYITTTGAAQNPVSSTIVTSPEAISTKPTILQALTLPTQDDGPGNEPPLPAALDGRTDKAGGDVAAPLAVPNSTDDIKDLVETIPSDQSKDKKHQAVGEVAQDIKIQTEQEEGGQNLQDAFERISFLISQRAKQTPRRDEGATEAVDDTAVRIETKKWMLETREGLLNLVGELQGHLWALERS